MPPRQNIWCVLGTRPEAIKLAPVIRELRRHADRVQLTVCLTGQHREMMAPLVELFDLRPDLDLDIMRPGQRPSEVFARVLERLPLAWRSKVPDWVIVQGDTTTTAAGALAAFYAEARVAHVEAGLRTGDRRQPFPEEINRRLVTQVADVHFAPTLLARDNLLREGIVAGAVEHTGNTVIDALLWAANQPLSPVGPLQDLQTRLHPARRLVLVTCHRRENHGVPLRRICSAIAQLAARHAGRLEFVFPVHPNPAVKQTAVECLGGVPQVHLVDPLPYLDLVHLLKRCWLVLTDSGGLQEEAPGLAVPVLVLRDKTERPEAVEAGVARLVGSHAPAISAAVESLLQNDAQHAAMRTAENPFGDGRAASRIVRRLLRDSARPDGNAHPRHQPACL